MLEETGLVIEVGELLAVVDLPRYRVHDFAATVLGGKLLAGDDADEVRWWSPEEVLALETSPGLVDELRRMRVL